MDFLSIGYLIVGVVLLVLGSDFLVKGASKLAAAAGISSLVIGLTVVAYGTSAPEMAVSAMAAFAGNADISVGNVVGSNIFNVFIILGISALIVPLTVNRQLIRLDVPLMIIVSFILVLLSLDGSISKIDGVLLFGGAIVYTIGLIRMSRRETKEATKGTEKEKTTPVELLKSLLFLIVGLVLLVVGSNYLVKGAVQIATALGVSQLIIGLTIVAAGTSMPELATSVTAAIRGERDIAIGNIVGSNIFNILAVLGFSGILSPNAITVASSALVSDLPIMILSALLCFPFFISGMRLGRLEGAVFILLYAAYTAFLAATGTNNPAADPIKYSILLVGSGVFVLSTIYAIKTHKKETLL